jgi:hypothetical protein
VVIELGAADDQAAEGPLDHGAGQAAIDQPVPARDLDGELHDGGPAARPGDGVHVDRVGEEARERAGHTGRERA